MYFKHQDKSIVFEETVGGTCRIIAAKREKNKVTEIEIVLDRDDLHCLMKWFYVIEGVKK